MTEERRLAAIMFTDMVGYTALMGRDEDRARYLVERSRAQLKSFVENYHGRWLEEIGDGTLSVFPSAVEAADCALAIQESLRREPEISLRIGIHLGDIVFSDGRVYGDGVNVASRIESLARPGGVAISEPVCSAIRGHARVRPTYLGKKKLKNVDEPMRVFALHDASAGGAVIQGVMRSLWARLVPQVLLVYALIGVTLVILAQWFAAQLGFHGQWVNAVMAGLVAMTPGVVAITYFRTDPGQARRANDGDRRWHPGHLAISLNLVATAGIVAIVLQGTPTMPGDQTPSIAVLPFTNLSEDEQSDYFSDGLTDELISTLARLEGLNVAARTSSFMFKGARKDVQEIARELSVRHILEGSVRKAGDQLRISVQLVDAASGYHVWQHTYKKTLDDVFAVQEDIAHSVAERLDLLIPATKAEQLAQRPTENMEAYNFYLQGLDYLHSPNTERNLNLAENLFRNAVMLDPQYAGAHSGLCRVALQRYELTNAPRHLDSGESACRTAMRLDDSLQEVRVALGHLYRHTGRLRESEAIFREVIEESPQNADAWVGLGKTLSRSETDMDAEAESALRRAVELQPADWRTHMALGEFLYWHNRFDEAEPIFERVVELTPKNARAMEFIGSAYLVYGRIRDGMDANRRAIGIAPSRSAYRNLGLGHLYLGEYAEAISMYRKGIELEREDHWIWGELGDALRHSGQEDEAQEAYETAANLAKKVLDRGGREPKVVARLAFYLVHLGRQEESAELYREAQERAVDDPEVLYYLAQIDQARGRPEAALDKLEKALEDGFPPAIIEPHPNFKALRDSERFQQLLAQEQ